MLIRDLLKELLPKLYNETRVRPELIREVEMGPFKHTVDGIGKKTISHRIETLVCLFI